MEKSRPGQRGQRDQRAASGAAMMMLLLVGALALALVAAGLGRLGLWGRSSPAAAVQRFEFYFRDPPTAVAAAIEANAAAGELDWSGEGLLYVKTHKTASSTLTSVLWRKLCLTPSPSPSPLKKCFLPPADSAGRIWNVENPRDKAVMSSGAPWDVWVHHVRLSDLAQLRQLVPSAAHVVTIVRRPALRFASAWRWYELSSFFDADCQLRSVGRTAPAGTAACTLSGFLAAAQKDPAFVERVHQALPYRSGLDATSEELTGTRSGDGDGDGDGGTVFEALLQSISVGRVVALVADRFDESLLLLRHLLRWPSLSDLLYLPLKSSSSFIWSQAAEVSNSSFELSAAEIEGLDELQPRDSQLFREAEAFLDAFIASFDLAPQSFDELLQEFRALLAAFQSYCRQTLQSKTASADSLPPPPPLLLLRYFESQETLETRCREASWDNRELVRQSWVRRGRSGPS